MSHISPEAGRSVRTYQRIDQAADTDRPQPVMTLAVGGSLLKVQGAKRPAGSVKPALRGKITGFSAAARSRLIELLSSLNKARLNCLPLFVTLTYPATWPEAPATWKKHLDVWLKRLTRAFPHCSAVWKLEFQSRGAPHFHLLLFGIVRLSLDWLSQSWYEVVGSGDTRHLQAGTNAQRCKSYRGVMYYASKYVGKKTNEPEVCGVGRFWGVHGRAFLPIDLVACPVTFGSFFRLRRALKHITDIAYRRKNGRAFKMRFNGAWQGCKLYIDYDRGVQLLRLVAAD